MQMPDEKERAQPATPPRQKRVTTDDLLDLADRVVALAGKAKQSSQYGVEPKLNEVLPIVLEAAKSVALAEAQDRRRAEEQT